VAGLLVLMRSRPRRLGLATALIALLVTLDLLHFAVGYQPIGPAFRIVPARTPAIAYLERHRDAGRISGVQVVAADWLTLHGLRDVRGADEPLPTRRFFRLWQVMEATAEPPAPDELSELTPQVLGLLGARFVLLPPQAQTAIPALRPVYRGADATIVENALAAPRAFVPAEVHVLPGARAEYATIGERRFDPRRHATLRAGEVRGLAPAAGAPGTARVIDEANASVTLRATLAQRGLVVLDDTWGPGWSVEVDGRPARALQTNAVLRGVVVPAGTHEVRWRYRVPGLRLGALLSAAGLLAALAWAGVLLARSRCSGALSRRAARSRGL
ncbi:MAG TPA: YfhO family protein, partial [Conexibacter sp.]|nr:YfhO family protein [Conexibacter sp.]